MDNSGRSILWFLGACLVFTQGAIAAVARAYTTLPGAWVLLFGFLSLAVVLGSLLAMFRINPAFITAERQDMVPLMLIHRIAHETNPEVLRELILTVSPEKWRQGEAEGDEESSEEADAVEPALEEAAVDEDGAEETASKDFQAALEAIEERGDGGA